MRWNGGSVIALTPDQLASAQKLERGLDRAFRQAGFFGEGAQTRRHRFPVRASGAAREIKINQVRSRRAIVADEVAHQDVEDVIVDRNGFAETRHAKK